MPNEPNNAADYDDEAEDAWMASIAREWEEELSDPREDIYTLDNGQPVDAVW